MRRHRFVICVTRLLSSFRERRVEGLKLKVLVDGDRSDGARQNEDAQLLINWLEMGAFDVSLEHGFRIGGSLGFRCLVGRWLWWLSNTLLGLCSVLLYSLCTC